MAHVKAKRGEYQIPLRVSEEENDKRHKDAIVMRDFIRAGYHPVEVARMMTEIYGKTRSKYGEKGLRFTRSDVEMYLEEYL